MVWPDGLGVLLSSFTRCLGVSPVSFRGGSGVPPSPVHVFRDHGICKEPECTSSPLHDVHQELFGLSPLNQRLSSGDDPLFPCRICVSQLPPGFPIALCSLLLRQHTLSSAQQWLCCWEDCLPKEHWTSVGKHLGAISSTCYLESGSWNRVGRNKADSVLSLINDCWDRAAGAGLARRYRGVTSGQECAARLWGFCCAGLNKSPAPCCSFRCFSPSYPLLQVGWRGVAETPAPESRRDDWWGSSSWRVLVCSWHPSGGIFLPLVCRLLLDHHLMAVLGFRIHLLLEPG